MSGPEGFCKAVREGGATPFLRLLLLFFNGFERKGPKVSVSENETRVSGGEAEERDFGCGCCSASEKCS